MAITEYRQPEMEYFERTWPRREKGALGIACSVVILFLGSEYPRGEGATTSRETRNRDRLRRNIEIQHSYVCGINPEQLAMTLASPQIDQPLRLTMCSVLL